MADRSATRGDRELRNFWPQRATPIQFGREDFRFRLYRRGRDLPAVSLDQAILHANWQRDGADRSAEINLQIPKGRQYAGLVAKGDEVLCEVAPHGAAAGAWKPLWRLVCAEPDHDVTEGLVSFALAGSASPFGTSELAWKFRADKDHPKGWTAAEITRDVCARLGVAIDRLPACSYRIRNLSEKKATGMDVVVRAWKAERRSTGRQFDVDISTGQLRITELRTPSYMLLLRDTLMQATVRRSKAEMASTIVATATVKARREKKARKLRVRVVDQARRRRYGEIVETMSAPRGIDTHAELRRWATRQLTTLRTPKSEVPVTLPGIPMLDRGDAVRLTLEDADIDSVAYLTSVRHDLSSGSYTVQATVAFSDPYVDARAERVRKMKQAAQRRRSGRAVARTAGGWDGASDLRSVTRGNG